MSLAPMVAEQAWSTGASATSVSRVTALEEGCVYEDAWPGAAGSYLAGELLGVSSG